MTEQELVKVKALKGFKYNPTGKRYGAGQVFGLEERDADHLVDCQQVVLAEEDEGMKFKFNRAARYGGTDYLEGFEIELAGPAADEAKNLDYLEVMDGADDGQAEGKSETKQPEPEAEAEGGDDVETKAATEPPVDKMVEKPPEKKSTKKSKAKSK